jgi:hypothetical protein
MATKRVTQKYVTSMQGRMVGLKLPKTPMPPVNPHPMKITRVAK